MVLCICIQLRYPIIYNFVICKINKNMSFWKCILMFRFSFSGARPRDSCPCLRRKRETISPGRIGIHEERTRTGKNTIS